MRRFPVLIVAVVCCLVLSALVGCGAQKEEPKMKIFENKNLSVSYPEGWSAGETVDDKNEFKPEFVSITLDAQAEQISDDAYIQITIVKDYKMPDFPVKPEDVIKNEKIGSVDFVTFTETNEKDKSEIKYCVGNKDGYSINITAQYSEKNKQIVEKVISTLKFKF